MQLRYSLLVTVSGVCLGMSSPAWSQTVLGGDAASQSQPNAPTTTPAPTATPTTAPQATPATAGSLSAPTAGQAQDASSGQEIIVTAQKREQRLADVPLSITAASGTQLTQAGVTSTADLVKIAPGFTFQQSQYGTPVFGIRGISFFDFSTASSPAVSVYVDQVPLPLSILTSGALLDVERVEVLKGPQGTLFGQNSTGGAVNYIAAKPTKEFSAGLDATYGRFDDKKLDGFVSFPITDTLGVRVAAEAEGRGPYQYSLTRDQKNGRRSFFAGRVILDWHPTDWARFELNANGYLDNSDTPAQQFKGFYPQFPGANPPVEAALAVQPIAPHSNRAGDWDPGFSLQQNNRFRQISLRGDIDITPDITLTSLSSYIRFNGLIPTDNDGTSVLNIRTRGIDDFKIFNQELRLAGKIDKLRWMIGGNYQHARLNETLFQDYDATNTVLAPVPGASFNHLRLQNNQLETTKSGFGSLEYEVIPKLTVSGSVRYTAQTDHFNGCTADAGLGDAAGAFSFLSTALRSQLPGFDGTPTTIAPGQCVTLGNDFRPVTIVNSNLDQNNTSWKGGISYKPTSDSLLYANVTKGYKAGSFTPAPFIRTSQITRVQQESVVAYEAGFKANFLRIAQVSGAGFYYDYRNKQITGFVDVFPFGNLPASVNVPKSRIEGGELSVAVRPIAGIRLTASGTYVDSKVTSSFVTATPLGNVVDLKGEQLPNAPKWQLNGDLEYRYKFGGGNSAYVGGAVTYQTGSYALFGENPQFRIPGYALVDLRAGVDFANGRWHAELFGRNITNKYYLTNISRSIDAVTAIAGMPSMYGVTVGFRL